MCNAFNVCTIFPILDLLLDNLSFMLSICLDSDSDQFVDGDEIIQIN